MNLPRIPVRRLLEYTPQQLWDNLEGDFIVVFDDGEIATNERATIYSSYAWEYLRRFPKTFMSKDHHVQSLMNKQRCGTDTHITLLGNLFFAVYDAYKFEVANRRELTNELALMCYRLSNQIYNELTYRTEAFVTGMSITDVIDITMDPRVLKALDEMTEDDAGIRMVYDVLRDIMKNDAQFRNNPVSQVYLSKLANEGQLLQCLGPRGTLTDIDSSLFRKMIKRSYTAGIVDMYGSMIESRSAAKSYIFSTDPLQKSEYFSRRQQLICMNVKNLHLGDCGSTHYMPWHIRGEPEGQVEMPETEYDPDIEQEVPVQRQASDLKTLAGMYYLNEETGQLAVIKATDKHLEGKTVKLRSIIAGCMHRDPNGICEVCYGDAAVQVPENSNIGHATCVSMTGDLGQLILSTKHFDGSSTVEGITLKPFERKFLFAQPGGNSYFLSPSLKSKKVKLVVGAKQAPGISDVTGVEDVTALSVTRVSEMSDITFMTTDDANVETGFDAVTVSVNGRNASMTHSLLEHIKRVGMEIVTGANREVNYIIDMAGYNWDEPILVLPLRHFNMSQLQQEISEMLESTMEQLEHRSNVVNPANMLVEFHDLVNKRLSVSLSVLQVILYSSMIVSADEHDYSLPKPWTKSGVGVKQTLLSERSLGPAMGYERHRSTLTHPSSYIRRNRMDHLFDILIVPTLLNGVEYQHASV